MFIKEIPNIHLGETNNFSVPDFFKTKDKGGIFSYVDGKLFEMFNSVIDSPSLDAARYQSKGKITEPNLFNVSEKQGIYVEMDLSHVWQICKRHIVDGEKLLRENLQSNVFFLCNKNGIVSKIDVWQFVNKGWWVTTRTFKIFPVLLWKPDRCCFFMRDEPKLEKKNDLFIEHQNN